jgi:acetyl esterase/lipase
VAARAGPGLPLGHRPASHRRVRRVRRREPRLAARHRGQRELAYLHCTTEGDCPAARAASPLFQIDRTDPPFFVTHSAEESKIPIGQSRAFVAKLRRAGVDTTFVVVQGRAHSIAMMNDDLKNRIVAFYQRTLGAKPVGVLN